MIPLEYDRIQYSRNNSYVVIQDGKTSFYDIKKGGLTDGMAWDKVEKVTYGDAYIGEKDKLKAILDLDGVQITPPIYERLWYSGRMFYFKTQKEEYGALNVDGLLCTPLFTSEFSYGSPNVLSKVEPAPEGKSNANSRSIVVNNLGEPKFLDDKIVRRGRYANLQIFEENNKMGLRDLYSEVEYLKPIYTKIKFIPPFTNKVIAKADEKWGILNLNGEWIASNKYDKLEVHKEALSSWIIQFAEKRYQYSATIGDRNGIINDRGEVLISIDYDASSSPFMMEEFLSLIHI